MLLLAVYMGATARKRPRFDQLLTVLAPPSPTALHVRDRALYRPSVLCEAGRLTLLRPPMEVPFKRW